MVITRNNVVRIHAQEIPAQGATSTHHTSQPDPPVSQEDNGLARPVQGTTSTQHTGPPRSSAPHNLLNAIQDEITTLSEEGKIIVNTIVKTLQTLWDSKDQKIAKLEMKVNTLEQKVYDLENQIDNVNQYERRDTIIVSGPSLPREIHDENSAEVVVKAVRDNLKINIQPTDINVAHRLVNKVRPNTNNPIIVKLHSRQKKEEIIGACITMKPNIFINESLTPKRLALFKTIWNIRRENRQLFQQCYTKDGKIYIKLRCSNQKHIVTNEQTLNSFLDMHPALRNK